MAFNFFGTYTPAQYGELSAFTGYSEYEIKKRITYLSQMLFLNGIFTTTFDDSGNPKEYTVNPPNSYGAKLLVAFKMMGGKPEKSFLLRTKDKPVHLKEGVSHVPGDNTTGRGTEYSNGRMVRSNFHFDHKRGHAVERLKAWQLEQIKYKREHLEFKIKRALDYSDMLETELELLNGMITDGMKSVPIMLAMADPTFNNAGPVVADPEDVHGLRIGEILDTMDKDDLDNVGARRTRLPDQSSRS